jgi:hypothetical protein
MYRVALNLFNKKPDRGIQMLIDWRYVDDHPIAIAKFMLTRRGLGKKMIGEFLGTLRSEFHAAVLRSVLVEIEMKGQEIDEALRTMIYFFQLPTEAQKIDYIMQVKTFHYSFNLNNYHFYRLLLNVIMIVIHIDFPKASHPMLFTFFHLLLLCSTPTNIRLQ